jgi:hypothetical protein
MCWVCEQLAYGLGRATANRAYSQARLPKADELVDNMPLRTTRRALDSNRDSHWHGSRVIDGKCGGGAVDARRGRSGQEKEPGCLLHGSEYTGGPASIQDASLIPQTARHVRVCSQLGSLRC